MKDCTRLQFASAMSICIAAATASRHLTLLAEAGLVVATRKKGWTFYRRDDKAIRQFAKQLQSGL